MLFAIPATLIGYYLTIRWQKDRCVRKARKMGIAYNKLLEDLEERLKVEERTERNFFNRHWESKTQGSLD
jgi:hypothetical protein